MGQDVMYEAGDLVIARSIVTWAGLEPMPSWGMMTGMRQEIELLLGLKRPGQDWIPCPVGAGCHV